MSEAPPAGSRLHESAAIAGILFAFAGPVVLLLAGFSTMTAATVGYAGIALFTGGIAARYGFITKSSPFRQLLINTFAAAIFAGFFFLIFLLL